MTNTTVAYVRPQECEGFVSPRCQTCTMRREVAGAAAHAGSSRMASFISLAALVSAASLAAGATPPPSGHLQSGDRLVYQLTLEVQAHAVPASGSSSKPSTKNDAGSGSETITISDVAPDGAATARFEFSYVGSMDGKALRIQRTMNGTVGRDGEVLVQGRIESPLGSIVDFMNQGAHRYATRRLRVGDVWTSTQRSGGLTIDFSHKVEGIKSYQGLPTYVIKLAGKGKETIRQGNTTTVATTSVLGTEYYDQRDALFVGGATRTLTVMEPAGATGPHVNVSLTLNVVLRSFVHAKASPGPAASASPTGPPPPTATPTPTSPPTLQPIVGPTPQAQPTVTPRSGY